MSTRTAETASPAAPLLANELAAVTRQIVDSLPEKFRTILVLREFEDRVADRAFEMLTVEARARWPDFRWRSPQRFARRGPSRPGSFCPKLSRW